MAPGEDEFDTPDLLDGISVFLTLPFSQFPFQHHDSLQSPGAGLELPFGSSRLGLLCAQLGKNMDALEAPGALCGLSLSQGEKPTAATEQEVVPFLGPLPTAQPRPPGAEGSYPVGPPSLLCPALGSESIFH